MDELQVTTRYLGIKATADTRISVLDLSVIRYRMVQVLNGTNAKKLCLGSFNLGWAFEIDFGKPLGTSDISVQHIDDLVKLVKLDREFGDQNWGLTVIDSNNMDHSRNRLD